MKLSEMNAHEKEAFRFITASISEYIGGFENQMLDNSEDSEEYTNAKEFLSQPHEDLVEIIYCEVMARASKGTAKHLRFAGTEFIKERISRRLNKMGY